MKDYYKILGVTEEASDEEIRVRWIELMKHYHPDLGKEQREDDRIKEINEAYQVLKNESTRMGYDLERDLRRSLIRKRAVKQGRKIPYVRIASVAAVMVLLFLVVGLLVSRRPAQVTHPITPLKDAASPRTELPRERSPKALPPAPEVVSKPLREAPVKTLSKPEIPVKTEAPSRIERQEVPAKVAKASPEVPQLERIKPEEAPSKVHPEPRLPISPSGAGLPAVERVNGRKELTPQAEPPVPKAEVPKPSLPEPPPVMKPEPTKQTEKVPRVETPKPESQEKAATPYKNGEKSQTAYLPAPEPLPSPKQGIPSPVEKPVRIETVKPEAKEKGIVEPKEAAKPTVSESSAPDTQKVTKPGMIFPIQKQSPIESVKPETREKVVAESKEPAKAIPKETGPTEVQERPKPPVVVKPKEAEAAPKPKEAEVVPKPKEIEKVAAAKPTVPEPPPAPKPAPPAKPEPALPLSPQKGDTQPPLQQSPPTKVETPLAPPPRPLPEEEEVKQFFAGYTERYNRKDVEGFLSFFSSGAIQNNKDRIDGIRKIYTIFFGESQELSYRLEEPKMEVHQNGLRMRARYEVNQILKKGRTRKTWKGQAQWFLVKEEGKWKILSLNYQHD